MSDSIPQAISPPSASSSTPFKLSTQPLPPPPPLFSSSETSEASSNGSLNIRQPSTFITAYPISDRARDILAVAASLLYGDGCGAIIAATSYLLLPSLSDPTRFTCHDPSLLSLHSSDLFSSPPRRARRRLHLDLDLRLASCRLAHLSLHRHSNPSLSRSDPPPLQPPTRSPSPSSKSHPSSSSSSDLILQAPFPHTSTSAESAPHASDARRRFDPSQFLARSNCFRHSCTSCEGRSPNRVGPVPRCISS